MQIFTQARLKMPILYSSINSTTYDFAVNYERVVHAMKLAEEKAQEEEIGLHVFSAFPLTGPTAQAYNAFLNTPQDGKEIISLIKKIAKEGSSKNSNLTTLISFPWYHRDPTVSVDHPFYYDATNTMNNRPFYATAVIEEGKITAINLESNIGYAEGGPYDARYFAKWPLNQTEIVTIGEDEILVGTLEVSPGLVNCPGFYHQEDIQALSQTPEYKDTVLIIGNPLGSDSGDKIGSGEVFVYKNGEKIYVTPSEYAYSFAPSMTQVVELHTEHYSNFAPNHSNDLIKASSLWMRDYVLKTKQQGFVISMSDGINSVYTLMIANKAIDSSIAACNGLEGFFEAKNFGHLACKKDVLLCLKTKGTKEAIKLLKIKMLTCVYMPYSAKESKLEQAQIQNLVDVVGGTLQISEIGKVLTSNFEALKSGIATSDNQKTLYLLENNEDVVQAAIERAQTTEAGIVGNMDNKICVSNTCANSVAYGRLHAGGAGQEGPISVTLSLFQTQIIENLQQLALEAPTNVAEAIKALINHKLEKHQLKDLQKEELIIKQMIINKSSPAETFEYLKTNHLQLWGNVNELLQQVDEACRLWSIAQPSRVALSIAPNFGSYGASLDRYRSVRNTRDNEYFNNGRVELRLQYLGNQDAELAMLVISNPSLRDYVLNTDFANLNLTYIQEQSKPTQVQVREVQEKAPDVSKKTFAFNVSVASLHQTMFDYARNASNIKHAIQEAETKGQDLLLLPELSLTGYFGDGDFDWIKNKVEGDKIMQQALNIAKFAAVSHLIISMGLPVFIEGYNKPFVGQALMHQGKIISISLKTMQPDGEAEYEAMHFTAYDVKTMGQVMNIQIPGQDEPVPVGKPVVVIKDKHGNAVPIYQEQCAEAWPGVNNDESVNKNIQKEQRYLNKIAKNHPGLLVLNPSGSKNEVVFPKTKIRQSLARLALEQNTNIAGYVYANVAGDDNGTVGADSDVFIAGRDEDGTLNFHHGMRHSLAEHTTTSMVMSIPKNAGNSADVTLDTRTIFNANQAKPGNVTGGPAEFDKQNLDLKTREYTETTYATSAWILNTLRHHKKQSFVISLSGGADSTLGAVQIVTAVDLFIKEHAQKSGLEAEVAKQAAIRELFRENFAHLHCKDEVLAAMVEKGADHAIKMIKNQILVCVYMPTANSSEDTLLSAKTLIQGGPSYKLDAKGHLIKPLVQDGPDLEGMGGRFHVVDLQKPMEEFILSYAGKPEQFNELLHSAESQEALEEQCEQWPTVLKGQMNPEQLLEKIIVLYSEKRLYDKSVFAQTSGDGKQGVRVFPPKLLKLLRQAPPSWWEKSHDLAKQNLQPRLRSICPWLLAELNDGIPLFTSNLSEAAVGYSTWAGDTSLGYENGLGGIFKSDVRRMLLRYESGQLCGLKPIQGLYYVNHLEPSAELRPLDDDGAYTQTDEADLMPYDNLDKIVTTMILEKRTPWQTFVALKDACNQEGKSLFKDDEERAAHIHKVCWLYTASQFKRTGGGNTPFLGKNLDSHLSQATTLFSQRLTNGRVEMNLKYLQHKEGRIFDQKFYEKAILNEELRSLIAQTPLVKLSEALDKWQAAPIISRCPATFFVPKPTIRKDSEVNDFSVVFD